MSDSIQIADETINSRRSEDQFISTLASGASIFLVAKIAGRGISILGQILFARLLGPTSFGLYAIGWTILRMLGLVAPLGLDKGVIRFGSEYWGADSERLKGVVIKSLLIALVSGSTLGLTFYILAPWLEATFQKPGLAEVIRWFSPTYPLITGLYVAAAATRISQRMKFAAISEDLSQPIFVLVFFFIFYFLGVRLIGIVISTVLSYAVALGLALYYNQRLFFHRLTFTRRSNPTFLQLISFSLPTAFASTFTTFVIWIDRLIVGYFRPEAETGIYQAVSQTSVIFVIILSAFNAILSPMIADLYHRQRSNQLAELFRVSTRWGLYLSLPAFLIFIFVPGPLLKLIFGAEYASGAMPMVILTWAQLINVVTGAVGYLLIMTGYQKIWFSISGVMLFIDILLNLFLVPRWGMMGAATATAVSVSGIFLGGLIYVKRKLGLWPYDRRYLKGSIAALLAVGAILLARLIPFESDFTLVGITGFLATSFFLGGLLLMGLESEDIEFLRILLVRIKKLGPEENMVENE